MAYLGGNGYLVIWMSEFMPEEVLAQKCSQLLGEEEKNEALETPRGFIIQDWFGPFLFAPADRVQEARC
jgi:hypothetical protein